MGELHRAQRIRIARAERARPTLSQATVDDLNTSFRGDVYGQRPSMTADAFRAHVERNGVDLTRSRRWTIEGALSGVVLLAFRGERAWIGGFGVVPAQRGRGLAQRYLDETIAIARGSSAASIELEVLAHNASAVRLYERAGFERIGDVVVWTRDPMQSPPYGETQPAASAYDAARVAALARTPAPCWQREPESVAAAALVSALDGRYAADALALLNEPAHGALRDALVAHPHWREFARQHRMRLALC